MITLYPQKVSGSITVPSSKSHVHRTLICASLSEGRSIIRNVDFNDDVNRTIEGLKNFGATITLDKHNVIVEGIDLSKRLDQVEINAHESGSTLRFLIPLASYLSHKAIFYGTETLINRPLSIYEELYKEDMIIEKNVIITKSIEAGHYKLAGNISSQFISGLLFVLPLLEEDSCLEISEPFESKPYVDLTVDVLKTFNIEIKNEKNKYFIKGNQRYLAQDIESEKDFSQAAFFAVLGAINNDITLKGLKFSSKQGDKDIFRMLESLGVDIDIHDSDVTVKKGIIKSGELDLSQTPDLGPILFVLGLFTDESLTLNNIQRLKIKESNRVDAMISELSKFNTTFEVFDEKIVIHKLNHINKVEVVDSHNDHRIAMALSIFSTILDYPLTLTNSQAVNKSYPKFYEDLRKLSK